MRGALADHQQEMIAEAIVHDPEPGNWKLDQGPEPPGHIDAGGLRPRPFFPLLAICIRHVHCGGPPNRCAGQQDSISIHHRGTPIDPSNHPTESRRTGRSDCGRQVLLTQARPPPSKGARNWYNFQIESCQLDVPKSHQLAASVPTAGLAAFRQMVC
jgi:hypothetical protein